MSIILDESTANDMAESIRGLMFHWHPNPNGADYCCEFCGREAESNAATKISHRDDCDGEKWLFLLARK